MPYGTVKPKINIKSLPFKILKSANNVKLYATDLDDYALNRASERLKEFNGNFKLIKSNFKDFQKIVEENGIKGFDGIILDLGVSSFQLDDKSRGFSYLAEDEILDMRMDNTSPFSALTVVNEYSEKELAKIFFEYGEERFSNQIARKICEIRKNKQITTCGELVEIIKSVIPKKLQLDGHPAKRVFQAIRIEVNGELKELKETVINMVKALNKGGRIAILTFHSLEDRLVKQAFKELETDCICPKNFPVCVCGKKREIKIINSKPITASTEELNENSRSKSAKLRIAEKI